MNKCFQLFYLAQWFLKARVFGQKKPLQSVVFVTGGCNSTCRHCTHCEAPESLCKPFATLVNDFRSCYGKGARILDVEGVNLVRWKDAAGEGRGVRDIFQAARDIGFYNISTMVPARDLQAWNALGIKVDVLWVSILRKEDLSFLNGKEKVSLYMVINRQNCSQLPFILEKIRGQENILQVAFNFYTPFAGIQELELTAEERKEVIRRLIAYKKKGYPIMNTVSGLKNMLDLNFKRYCWICNFVYCDGRRSPVCVDDEQSGLCSRCGFSMSGEMNAVFRFKPDTILAGLKSRS